MSVLNFTSCADDTRLEAAVGVDHVYEGCGLLGEDVGSQLGDLIHIGAVHKPGKQSEMK